MKRIEMVYKRLKDNLISTLEEDKQYYVGAACIDHKGQIISIGYNSYKKTHPEQKRFTIKNDNKDRCFLHAEIAALVKTRKKPYGIMVMRMLGNNDVRMAKPCRICEMALKEAGIEQVWYTDKDGILRCYYLRRI